MEYIRENIPLWSITIWDKSFNNVEKEWQPKIKKYKYLLADELDSLKNENGDVKILYTGKDTGFTTEELAGDAIAEGEVVAIPWGGIPNVKYYKGKFVTGDNRIATSSDTSLLTNKYLYYFMKGNMKVIASFYRGASLKHPSMRDVLKMSISFPFVEEQNRIVAQFDCIERVIALRQQELAELDNLIKARFVEMFGNPVENHKGYLVKTLQELIDLGYITYHLDGNHGGDYPRSEEFVETGVPYISANCIVNGEIDFSKSKYLTSERANKLRKGIANNEDVLFAHNATVGPTVVLHTNEEKVILGTSLTAYRCNKEKVLPYYLKSYMLSDGFVRQYSGEMKQTTRNQVPITVQKKYLFLIPSIDEQEQFADFVNRVDKSKFAA